MTPYSEYLNEINALEKKRERLAKETMLSDQNKSVALSQLIRIVKHLEARQMPYFVLRDALKATNDFVDKKIPLEEYLALSREMGKVHPMDERSSMLANAMMAFSWAVFFVSIFTLPFIPAVLGIITSFVLADIARELRREPRYYQCGVSNLGLGMNKVSRYSFLNTEGDNEEKEEVNSLEAS